MGYSGDPNNNTPVKAMQNPTMWDIRPDQENQDAMRYVLSPRLLVLLSSRDDLLIPGIGHTSRARTTAWT